MSRREVYVEAYKRLGSLRAAAAELGLNESTVRRSVAVAAQQDPSLHSFQAPAGYMLSGVSTQTKVPDGQGGVTVQWVKTARGKVRPEEILEAFREVVADAKLPTAPKRKAPAATSRDLLAVYPLGDPHLGMLSWHQETGQNFDLKIAQKNLRGAMQELVALAPPAEQGLIINLGDYFHSDNSASTTTRGTPVDVDGRWAKVLKVGITTMVGLVELALRKHKRVRVISERGNHDTHSSLMLALCLEAHFRNESRVEIDTSPQLVHWHEFGKNLIGTHHGHTIAPQKLPNIMIVDKKESWSRTDHRKWYTGHVHHQRVFEFPGCTVESFQTLAARDAWHSSQGYRSNRSAVVDVWHRNDGDVARFKVKVEQLK